MRCLIVCGIVMATSTALCQAPVFLSPATETSFNHTQQPASVSTQRLNQVSFDHHIHEIESVAAELKQRGDNDMAARLQRVAAGLKAEQARSGAPVTAVQNPLLGGPERLRPVRETNFNPDEKIVGIGAAANSVVAAFRGDLMRIKAEEGRMDRMSPQTNPKELQRRREEVKKLKTELAAKVRRQAPDIVRDLDMMMRSAPAEERVQIQRLRDLFADLPEEDDELVLKISEIQAQADARFMKLPARPATSLNAPE